MTRLTRHAADRFACGSRRLMPTLGGWYQQEYSDMSDVKEHMLIHSILPKKE